MEQKNEQKTNVMRLLDKAKVPYRSYTYTGNETTAGTEVAALIDRNPDQVFKTLVTVGKSNRHYVFVIPVSRELDLRKAAACVDEKAVQMLKAKDLLPLTGYVHGGCSPIGMKKAFTTVLDATAEGYDTILFSAGKIGYQVEIDPAVLPKLIPCSLGDVT